MLDLTPILHNPKAAVHCTTYEQAEQFVNYMRKHHRQRVFSWNLENWHSYGKDTCYSPYFGHPTKSYMTYCPIDHYVECGFDIIEFDELTKCVMELDTELGGESLDFLLG